MAKAYKRRTQKKNRPQISKHDQIYNRRRSTAEKVMLILGILIALSMVLSLIASIGGNSF